MDESEDAKLRMDDPQLATVSRFDQWVSLATRVRAIRSKNLQYLRSFYNKDEAFFALQDPASSEMHITSTVMCVLELTHDPSLLEQFELDVDLEVRSRIRDRVLSPHTEVTSVQLPVFNPYTAPIYTVGLARLGHDMTDPKAKKALETVFQAIEVGGSVRWNEEWEASGFLAYWCWRAMRETALQVPNTRKAQKCAERGSDIEAWAEHEFYRQFALGMAGQSGFDPMNLGYAMTICMAQGEHCPIGADLIEAGIGVLFSRQAQDGVWAAFGGIFPNLERGTAYVFAPEMLAVLLAEARSHPALITGVYDGLSKLVQWIEQNERRSGDRSGWTSNHLPFKTPPESWSTAAVLGSLREIDRLSRSIITESVVRQFNGATYRKDSTAFERILDSDVKVEDNAQHTVKEILTKYIIEPRAGAVPRPKEARKSVILFGPRSTAKTSYAKAIAKALGWALISLRIGHFLAKGMPEIENRLFTGNTLTLLQDLYERGRGIYIVATNYADEFDRSVKRPGRFDIILKVMPPSKQAKCGYLLERLQREGLSSPKEVKRFVNQRFDRDLRPLTFTEWEKFARRVIEEAEGGTLPRETLASVLEAEFRDPLLTPEELEFKERSVVF